MIRASGGRRLASKTHPGGSGEHVHAAAALDARHAAALRAAREEGAAGQAALDQQLQAAQRSIAALQGEVAAVRDE
ncbi:hypothetical protein ACLB1G_19545 [Oxalobacteraceae bacterium A2-2]